MMICEPPEPPPCAPTCSEADPLSTLTPDAYRAVLDALSDGVYIVDRDRRIVYWNRGAEALSGFCAKDVIGRSCADNLLTHIDSSGKCLCKDGCPLAATICDGQTRHAQVFMHHRDGHRVPVHVKSAPFQDSKGSILGAIEVFNAGISTESLQATVKTLGKLALLDVLTALPNRRHLQMKLGTALREMRSAGSSLGLLIIDADYFKRINDKFGHDVGDQALQMIGRTLSSAIRTPNVVGRWGGEEFLAILPNVAHNDLYTLAHHVRTLVEQSYLDLPRGMLRLTVSIGAAMAGPDESIDSLLKKADDALYLSKSAGRNRVTVASDRLAGKTSSATV